MPLLSGLFLSKTERSNATKTFLAISRFLLKKVESRVKIPLFVETKRRSLCFDLNGLNLALIQSCVATLFCVSK